MYIKHPPQEKKWEEKKEKKKRKRLSSGLKLMFMHELPFFMVISSKQPFSLSEREGDDNVLYTQEGKEDKTHLRLLRYKKKKKLRKNPLQHLSFGIEERKEEEAIFRSEEKEKKFNPLKIEREKEKERYVTKHDITSIPNRIVSIIRSVRQFMKGVEIIMDGWHNSVWSVCVWLELKADRFRTEDSGEVESIWIRNIKTKGSTFNVFTNRFSATWKEMFAVSVSLSLNQK